MRNSVRVADEVWLATASLHRKHPGRNDFSVHEILQEAEAISVNGLPLRPGVKVHIYQHCVANKPPNTGNYRMLFETSSGRRRLFIPGDPCDPRRAASKSTPERDAVPDEFGDLIDWYHRDYIGELNRLKDPVLALRGLGKEIWAHEDAEDFVRRQRQWWS